MADILSDSQIRNILGKLILNADENLVNPNGIELRLGKFVYFHSTQEEFPLTDDNYVEISPGETISFTSFETIDFQRSSVQVVFPNSSLMGFITPTTTMMREGILQTTTKIDSGFKGILNWSLRNGSSKEIILQYQEPIFKLTIFKLTSDENPDTEYGNRDSDKYQNTEKILHSHRKLPAHIPKNKIIKSAFKKIDPTTTLKEAGYPFNFIGTELAQIQGKFEIVSKDMLMIKDQFSQRSDELSRKIDSSEINLSTKVEKLFSDQLLKILAIIFGAVPLMAGIYKLFQKSPFQNGTLGIIYIFIGLAIFFFIYLIVKKNKK